MTIAPLTPASAPFPTTGAGAGSSTAGDFLAEMLDALAAPVAPEVAPVVTAASELPVAVPPLETVAAPSSPAVGPVETPAPEAQTPPSSPLPSPLPALPSTPDVEPVETPAPEAQTQPPSPDASPDASPDPTVAVCTGLTPNVTAPAPSPENPGKHLGTATVRPGLRLGQNHTEHPVTPAPAAETAGPAPRLDKLEVRGVPPIPTAPAGSPVPTTLAVAPIATPIATSPIASTPIAAAPIVAAPVSIPEQVHGAVTSLVSRGNGTHRITMTLQPEQLGEVRVVLTVRDGAVHVRLAAGQEARTALADGSGELTRLLERSGATETRISVRELPATAVSTSQPVSQHAAQPAPTTPTTDTASTPVNTGLDSGGRSPDRHAGTRADRSATDGDDQTRGPRSGGRRDVTPIRSVIGSRVAGVDLTM